MATMPIPQVAVPADHRPARKAPRSFERRSATLAGTIYQQMPVATVHYLTVQDVLWINQELTKKECEFKFAQLEEATSYQYGYRKSRDVLKQAGAFLQGFLKMRPFSEGSQQTALIATLAFLTINGYEISLQPDEANALLEKVASKQITGEEAVKQIARESNRPPELNPAIRTHIRSLIQKFGDALIPQGSTEAS